MPFRQSAGARPGGFLVAGLNSGRPLDEDYRAFASLAAGHIAAAIAGVAFWKSIGDRDLLGEGV